MSARRSAPKFTAAFEPKYAPPMPPAIMRSAVAIISAIIVRLVPDVSVPAFALLITTERSLGMTTSPMTSTIMQSGPSIK